MNNKGNLTDERPPLLPVIIIGTGFGSGFGLGDRERLALYWQPSSGQPWLTDSVLRARACRASPSFSSLFLPFSGTWATAQLQPYWGEDPSRVVIDEMVGVWIPPVVADPVYGAGRSERCLVVGIGGTCSLPLL